MYLFRAYYLTNKPLYTPGEVFVILHTNPTCNIYKHFLQFLNTEMAQCGGGGGGACVCGGVGMGLGRVGVGVFWQIKGADGG